MSNISRQVIVVITILAGVLLLFFAQSPHTVCDSQKEIFLDSQKGLLFPKSEKRQRIPAQYFRFAETCKNGLKPGSCYELFALLKRTLRDAQAAPQDCSAELAEIPELKRALSESLDVMVTIAWGSHTPVEGEQKYGWLEGSDFAIFCQLKRNYLSLYGQEEFDILKKRIQNKLPGEPIIIQDGTCLNCESRKAATEILSDEEIWAKSLFSIRCDQISSI